MPFAPRVGISATDLYICHHGDFAHRKRGQTNYEKLTFDWGGGEVRNESIKIKFYVRSNPQSVWYVIHQKQQDFWCGSNKASIAQNSSTCLRTATEQIIVYSQRFLSSLVRARVQNCTMSIRRDVCFLPSACCPFNYPADSYIYWWLDWLARRCGCMTQKFSHRMAKGRAARIYGAGWWWCIWRWGANIFVNHSRSANFVESKVDGNMSDTSQKRRLFYIRRAYYYIERFLRCVSGQLRMTSTPNNFYHFL